MSYILISAVKNEKENLSDLFESVCNQTMLPELWIIVDDCSSDGSQKILYELSKKKNFIHIVNLKESKRNLLRVYQVLDIGVNLALDISKNLDNNWQYLGILDGDIKLPSNYYETLIKKLSGDNSIGIISGKILSLDGKSYKEIHIDIDKPGNAARLITRRCYEVIGFSVMPAGDSVMNIHAKNKGLKTLVTNDVYAYQIRPTNSALGYWKSHSYLGYLKYYLGCTPTYAILYTLKIFLSYPYFHCLAFAKGYFIALVKKDKRIDDFEVKSYYRVLLKNIILKKLTI